MSEDTLYKYCPRCARKLFSGIFDKQKVKKCTKCGFIFWNNPKPVVSIILHKGQRVLMLQRAHEPLKDHWVLPGGFMSYDETPQDAIQREAREEIGSDVIIKGIVGVYRIDNDPRGIHIDIIYHGKSTGKISTNNENKTNKYFLFNKLPERIAYKHRNAITDWYTKGNKYG